MVDFISEGNYSDLNNDNNSLAFEYSDSKKALYDFFNEKCNADYDISIKPQFGYCLTDSELNYTTHVGDLFNKRTLINNYYRQNEGGKVDNDDWRFWKASAHELTVHPYYNEKDTDEVCTPYKVTTYLNPEDSTVTTTLFHPATGNIDYKYKIDPESIKIEGDTVSFCTGDKIKLLNSENLNGKVEVNIKRKYTWW